MVLHVFINGFTNAFYSIWIADLVSIEACLCKINQ